MTERVASDHDAVRSHRVNLDSVGRTGRPRVPVPDGLAVTVEDVVRVDLEADAAHARVETSLKGEPVVDGAFADPALARSGEGENLLAAWVDEHGLDDGDPLLLDVVTEGYQYGLRQPGERVVYEAAAPPDDGLSDIAERLG